MNISIKSNGIQNRALRKTRAELLKIESIESVSINTESGLKYSIILCEADIYSEVKSVVDSVHELSESASPMVEVKAK